MVRYKQKIVNFRTKNLNIMDSAICAFKNRFGYYPPSLTSKIYTTHIGLSDVEYSCNIDGITYIWSPAYGWYDEFL